MNALARLHEVSCFWNSCFWSLTASGELVRKCVVNDIDPGGQVRNKQQTCLLRNRECLLYPPPITQAVSQSADIMWSLLIGYTCSVPLIVPVARPSGRQQMDSSLGVGGLNFLYFQPF